MIHRRTLGRTGFQVSEIGFGAWGIGGNQWRGHSEDEARAALRRALELGLNFIDTALAYNEGHSERIIGETLRETGAQARVATKVPPKNRIWPAQPGIGIEDVFPYDYVVRCTETSLRNLGVETLDLQQFHVWNPEWLERDDWRRAIEDTKKSGKVRFWGISINDHQPANALKTLGSGLVSAVQVIYNIFDRSPEEELFPYCLANDIGVIVRVPLDEGGLTGSITPQTTFEIGDFRRNYFRGDRAREVYERVERLKGLLGTEAGTVAELALRCALSHPAVSTIIPGMRTAAHVAANAAISDGRTLSDGLLEALRAHEWRRNFYGVA